MPKVLSSHLTNNLDRGVRRLLAMWPVVKKELEAAFIAAEKTQEDEEKEDQGKNQGKGGDDDDEEEQEEKGESEPIINTELFKVLLSF